MRRCEDCRWSINNECYDNSCEDCPIFNTDLCICKCTELIDDDGDLCNCDCPDECPYYEEYERSK